MLVSILTFIAVGLTCTMFATKQAMLGFACVIFWAILGAYAYLQSTTPWGDIWFYMFFACMFGMTIFCALAAYGLREVRDTLGDEALEEGDDERVGEGEPEMGDEVPTGEKKTTARERLKQRRKEREDKRMGRYRR